jgi:hypothetical protein
MTNPPSNAVPLESIARLQGSGKKFIAAPFKEQDRTSHVIGVTCLIRLSFFNEIGKVRLFSKPSLEIACLETMPILWYSYRSATARLQVSHGKRLIDLVVDRRTAHNIGQEMYMAEEKALNVKISGALREKLEKHRHGDLISTDLKTCVGKSLACGMLVLELTRSGELEKMSGMDIQAILGKLFS